MPCAQSQWESVFRPIDLFKPSVVLSQEEKEKDTKEMAPVEGNGDVVNNENNNNNNNNNSSSNNNISEKTAAAAAKEREAMGGDDDKKDSGTEKSRPAPSPDRVRPSIQP